MGSDYVFPRTANLIIVKYLESKGLKAVAEEYTPLGHRDFARVSDYMHQLHEVLAEQVPMIPLWQLDPLMAWAKSVHPPTLDPLLVFTDIEQWKIDAE